jgi:hypothetical protein
MADSGRTNAFIARAVTVLLDDSRYGPRLSNCWLPASAWAATSTKSGHIDASLASTDARKFNVAMSKSNSYGELMTRFNGTNQTGLFRVKYARQYFYYFTDCVSSSDE